MASRLPKSVFSLRPDERENISFRLPAGTKERIADISKRLHAINPKFNFELAAIVEVSVARAIEKAEKELDALEQDEEPTGEEAAVNVAEDDEAEAAEGSAFAKKGAAPEVATTEAATG